MRIQTTLEKVNTAIDFIRERGGTVRVNGNSGKLYISGVEAGFSFSDGILIVEIYDKPWLASKEMIEREIKKFFE